MNTLLAQSGAGKTITITAWDGEYDLSLLMLAYEKFRDAEASEYVEDEEDLYDEAVSLLSQFSKVGHPRSEALVLMCHCISPYVAKLSKDEFGGYKIITKSMRMVLGQMSAYIQERNHNAKFVVVLFHDVCITLFNMCSVEVRRSVFSHLVTVHDVMCEHINHMYTSAIGHQLVCTIIEHLDNNREYRTAGDLAKQWAKRSRETYWSINCNCESTGSEYKKMIMTAVELLKKDFKRERDLKERIALHDALEDAQGESLRLAEHARKARAKKSKLAREMMMMNLQEDDAHYDQPEPPAPQQQAVNHNNHMARVVRGVHRMDTQRKIRSDAFEKRKEVKMAEASKARALKKEAAAKKKRISMQKLEPVPEAPMVVDFLPSEL